MGTSFGGSLYCLCCCCLLESCCGPLFGRPPPGPAATECEKVVDSAIDEMWCCVHGRIVSLFLLRVGSMRTGCQRRQGEGQREDRYRLSTANEGKRWWNWLRGGCAGWETEKRGRDDFTMASHRRRAAALSESGGEWERQRSLFEWEYEWWILGIWDLIFFWTFL